MSIRIFIELYGLIWIEVGGCDSCAGVGCGGRRGGRSSRDAAAQQGCSSVQRSGCGAGGRGVVGGGDGWD